MIAKIDDLMNYYYLAYAYVCENGYEDEIDYVTQILPLSKQTPEYFLSEYIYVVLNAGMREQVAQKIYIRFMDSKDLSKIGHLGKRNAISTAIINYKEWFQILQKSTDPIQYLETLPWIGPITKYHLARNIGIDTVKPDRHLVRLAEQFGFTSPLSMCQEIQKHESENLGVIDVILWRYCNLCSSRGEE